MSEEPKTITRYDPDWDKDMAEAEDGDWVRFEDYDDVVRELREALAGLERMNYSTMTDAEMQREADLGNQDAPPILRARAVLAKLTLPTP